MALAVAAVMRPEASVIARPSVMATACRSSLDRHVVEQDRVDAERQHLFELRQRIDLDLDLDEVAGMGLGALDRGADVAGKRDMVVLDQHGIVETEAVIAAAAGADRVFFQRAQSGRRLAGADDARLAFPARP